MAGNLVCDALHQCASGGATLVAANLTVNRASFDYDGENRMVRAGSGGSGYGDGGTSYTYDGEGRRVRKAVTGGEETVFVYDAAGRVVAEYSNVVQTDGTSYLTQDHLGSTRVVTDAQGNAHSNNGASGSRHDYFPFGEEIQVGMGGRATTQGYGAADNVRQQFTGKERDSETGLDFFGARYYANPQGRFTSVDPMGMDKKRLLDPQLINAYVYTRNNPLRYVDPDGADPKDARVVVVIFQGGHWSTDSVSGSSSGGTGGATTMVRVTPGQRPDGLGESKIDPEAPHIAQQIKNDYAQADVIFAGPDAKDEVFKDLTENKPDKIILYGYSRGGIKAVELTNELNNRGQKVDLLITVDPLTRPSFSDPKIENTSMVGEAINYTEHGAGALRVTGAKNYGVGTAMREDPNKFPPTPIEHGTLDDITSPYVIKKIEDKLRDINR